MVPARLLTGANSVSVVLLEKVVLCSCAVVSAGEGVRSLLQAQEGVRVICLHPKRDLNGEGALGGVGQLELARCGHGLGQPMLGDLD